MSSSVMNIVDLPNEILFIICTKLTFLDMSYSLVGINERLDKIICDSIFSESINLVSTDENDTLFNLIIKRLCLEVFPLIHQNIKCLTLTPTLLERILHANDYPHLHKINLVNLKRQPVFDNDYPQDPICRDEEISRLIVSIIDDTQTLSVEDTAIDFYDRIFSLFTKLTHLVFTTDHTVNQLSLFLHCLPSNICSSSSIVYLSIKVLFLDDCYCLLDGRLPQLETLLVTIDYFPPVAFNTNQPTIDIPNLKCFSLMSRWTIRTYNEEIVPLLRQMSQLEELTLSLDVYDRTTFIDGTHLNNEVFTQMPYLRQFMFDIVTYTIVTNNVPPSIEDIQQTFAQPLHGYMDYSSNESCRYHIYSFPFILNSLHTISNNFPDDIFINVRTVSVADDARPFEHDFFQRISRSFPFLQRLTIFNLFEQKKLYENETQLSIIEFAYLTELNLNYAHVDYAKQFLIETNTSLPLLRQLQIQYEDLMIVTENLTRNSTRFVCSKLKRLVIDQNIAHCKAFYLYFPLL